MKSVGAPEETVKNLPDDQTVPAATRLLTNKRNGGWGGGGVSAVMEWPSGEQGASLSLLNTEAASSRLFLTHFT